MEDHAHVLAASGALQIKAFLRIVESRPENVSAYILWAGDPKNLPRLSSSRSIVVTNLIEANLGTMRREIRARKHFKRTMQAISDRHSERVTLYANGAQHFFGNDFIFRRNYNTIQVLDGMSTFVPRPVFFEDRKKMIMKVIIGLIAGLPYRPFSGEDILLSERFDARNVKDADYLQGRAPLPGPERSVLFFDQGLFEIISDPMEQERVRARTLAGLQERFDTILYRRHPRTQALAWLDGPGFIDVTGVEPSEVLARYRPHALASFYSTALIEFTGIDRFSFLPLACEGSRIKYLERLKKFMTMNDVTVLEV